MKILGREIHFGGADRVAEKFKGFFSLSSTPIPKRHTFWINERSWLQRCTQNLQTYMQFGQAKSQVLTIAGQTTSDGLFLQLSSELEDPHTLRAKDALYECEQLNRRMRMRDKLHTTFFNMALYGSCFWEKTEEPQFEARIIPRQAYIEPEEQDEQGEIIKWRQLGVHRNTIASWTQNEIIHFPWNITDLSWPYGTSLLAGAEVECEIISQLKTDLKEYMHKTAFPMEFLSVGDKDLPAQAADVSDVRTQARAWGPGEKIVSNYSLDYKVGGVGDREVKGLDKVLGALKEDVVDSSMTPPVSYQYNSTYASSKEMSKVQRANLILPLQTIVAGILEEQLYKPYLEYLGYSVKLCPTVGFDPPDANFVEEAQAYSQLVQSGILTPEIAASEMGYTEEQIEQMRLEREQEQQRKMELFQKQAEQSQTDQQQDQTKKEGKSWVVTEYDNSNCGSNHSHSN